MTDSIKDHIKSRISRITMSKVTDEEVEAALSDFYYPNAHWARGLGSGILRYLRRSMRRVLEQFASSRAVPVVNDDELVKRMEAVAHELCATAMTSERWNMGDDCREAASRISDQAAEIERWRSSFVGHVYVKDDEYAALCQAAEPAGGAGFVREINSQRIAFLKRAEAAERHLADALRALDEIKVLNYFEAATNLAAYRAHGIARSTIARIKGETA